MTAGEVIEIDVRPAALYRIAHDRTETDTTLVTCVDISDPAGQIVPTDQFRVPGTMRERFFADELENTLRILTQAQDAVTIRTVVALNVYDVSNPADITRLASLPIQTDETLPAVRFDGPRAAPPDQPFHRAARRASRSEP